MIHAAVLGMPLQGLVVLKFGRPAVPLPKHHRGVELRAELLLGRAGRFQLGAALGLRSRVGLVALAVVIGVLEARETGGVVRAIRR